jgi:hypothetical protein
VKAAADLAKEKGVSVRLETDGAIVITPVAAPVPEESPLQKWKREDAERRAREHTSNER